jgi:hypothetical protein
LPAEAYRKRCRLESLVARDLDRSASHVKMFEGDDERALVCLRDAGGQTVAEVAINTALLQASVVFGAVLHESIHDYAPIEIPEDLRDLLDKEE